MAATPCKSDTSTEAPSLRRRALRDQAAGTLKVIMLAGGLLGGLWLLQLIAAN